MAFPIAHLLPPLAHPLKRQGKASNHWIVLSVKVPGSSGEEVRTQGSESWPCPKNKHPLDCCLLQSGRKLSRHSAVAESGWGGAVQIDFFLGESCLHFCYGLVGLVTDLSLPDLHWSDKNGFTVISYLCYEVLNMRGVLPILGCQSSECVHSTKEFWASQVNMGEILLQLLFLLRNRLISKEVAATGTVVSIKLAFLLL